MKRPNKSGSLKGTHLRDRTPEGRRRGDAKCAGYFGLSARKRKGVSAEAQEGRGGRNRLGSKP